MPNVLPTALRLSVAAIVLVGLAGCAGGDPVTTLQQMKIRQINVLAQRCFAANEGARAAVGGLETWLACKAWAARQVP